MPSLLISGASEVLTCTAGAPDLIGRTTGVDVLIEDGRIKAVGRLQSDGADEVLKADGGVVMPGFVDCHTHVVFGGSRVEEYVAGVVGELPPIDAPVGIVGTMMETRQLSVDELVEQAQPRLLEMLEHGTTTVESKSGYGLAQEAELRILEANHRLDADLPLDVVSTYLGAHAYPPEAPQGDYVEEVLRTIPVVADRGLASFCDAYCDDGYFTPADTRRILVAGREHGLASKVHLDAYTNTGFAQVAAELVAVSVDHLNYTTPQEVEQLAAAGVIGVLMPCLDFAVAHPKPVDGRHLIDLGLSVAIATDMCPGCHTATMQLVIQHACRTGGLSVAQAIQAATLTAARALGRADDIGSLEPGKRADILVLDVPVHEDLAYRLGHNAVRHVIKDGEVVVSRSPGRRSITHGDGSRTTNRYGKREGVCALDSY